MKTHLIAGGVTMLAVIAAMVLAKNIPAIRRNV